MFELYFFSDQWFELIKTGSADAVVHYDNKLINTRIRPQMISKLDHENGETFGRAYFS